MKCFACDGDLPETAQPDRPTDRWYCNVCFAPTLEVQLAASVKDLDWVKINDTGGTSGPFDIVDVPELDWEDVSEIVGYHFEPGDGDEEY